MMFSFAADYFLMVFVASLGVMQAAASIGGLRGLLVFKNPLIARSLGIGVAIAAMVWFFLIEERNINDYEGGLDSNEQGLLFFLAVAASGIFTCVLTSLVNWRMAESRDGEDEDESVELHPHSFGNPSTSSGQGRTGSDLPPSRGKGQEDSEKRERGHDMPEAGLGALRDGTWWQAVRRNYRYWFSEGRCWRTRIKRYFSG